MADTKIYIDNANKIISYGNSNEYGIGESLLSFVEMDLDNVNSNHPYLQQFQTNKKTLTKLQAQYGRLVMRCLSDPYALFDGSNAQYPFIKAQDIKMDMLLAEKSDVVIGKKHSCIEENLYFESFWSNASPQSQPTTTNNLPDGIATLDNLEFNPAGVNVTLQYCIIKKGETYSLLESYIVSDLAAVCYLEFMRMAQLGLNVRKCQNCNRFFIPKWDYEIKYCDRIPEGEKHTCQYIGSHKLYQKKIADSPILSEYNKIYRRLHSRKRYKMITPEEFKAWTEQGKKIRDKAVADNWTVEQFIKEIEPTIPDKK